MNFPCFVVGSLAPSLNLASPAGQGVNQRQAICMGRRSDKIKNRKEKATRARTKVR